jgi:exosortase
VQIRPSRPHHLWFAGLSLLTIVACQGTLAAWLRLSLHSERYSHLWMIPLVSAYMILEIRKTVFGRLEWAPDGAVAMAIGVACFGVGWVWPALLGPVGDLTLKVLGVATVGGGLFRLCYGRQAWRAAKFPVWFLLFAVPVPQWVLDRAIEWLQVGSAAVVDALLLLSQAPYVRSGLEFELAGLTIEIAPQCSGIRSSIALLIVAVLVAHYLLRRRTTKLLLVALVIPLVLFKNGLRIATLSLLAVYVDPRFITGSLHHKGGVVFFGLMLLVLGAWFWVLRKAEKGAERKK